MEEPNKAISPATQKKLTGATMNMRFMKRKNIDATPLENSVKLDSDAMEWISATVAETSTDPSQNKSTSYVLNKQNALPQQATDVDTYGLSAKIIGRRSFKNFNKAVQDTYQAMLDEKVRGKARAKAAKHTISDEEMLDRYKKYVQGEDNNKVAPVGNLDKKNKRAKNRPKQISSTTKKQRL